MKIKKKLIYAITIVSLLIVTLSIICVHKYMQVNDLSVAQEQIRNEEYEEALNTLKEKNIKNTELLAQKEKYISIIEDYLKLANMEILISNLESVNEFYDNYSEDLKEDLFSKMNTSILEIKDKINCRQSDIDDLVGKIEELIESEDIEKAEELIKELNEKYSDYDDSNIKENLEKKNIEIENRKLEEIELKEAEDKNEEDQIANEDSTEENTETESSSNIQLQIASTNAAQNSNQLITVVSTGGSTAEVKLWQKGNDGIWYEYDSMSARIGSNGMKTAAQVYEMDMCTPTGSYSLTESFGVAANPGTNLPYRVLDGSEYWIDDPESEYYNTMQFGAPNGRWESAEHLSDYQNAYRYSIVIDYNRWPVIAGKSSAIFLHCDTGLATWGCVAVPEDKMIKILNWIESTSSARILLDFSYENIYINY